MVHLERVGEVRVLQIVGNGAEHLEEEGLPVQDVQLLHQELQAGSHQAVRCYKERGEGGFRDLFFQITKLGVAECRDMFFIKFKN